MLTSQNGWSANDRSLIASYELPGDDDGGRIALRAGDVSVVLLWVACQFHDTVEPLEWPGNWGYAERPIRGSSTTLSNHASGTAIDLNAPMHPLGKRGTFTDDQVRAIREILGFCEGTVRWGGDYRSRADEMHFEVVAGSGDICRVADKIREGATIAPPVRKKDIVLKNHFVQGAGVLRIVCPVGRASAMTARAFISAASNAGPEPATIEGWFQDDDSGIAIHDADSFTWVINFKDGHSERPWIEFPDGATQVNLHYNFPRGGAICLEAMPK